MFSPHKKRNRMVTTWGYDLLNSLIVVIISKFICISNHHILHLNYMQFLFVNYASISWGKRMYTPARHQVTNRQKTFEFMWISASQRTKPDLKISCTHTAILKIIKFDTWNMRLWGKSQTITWYHSPPTTKLRLFLAPLPTLWQTTHHLREATQVFVITVK